MKKCNNCENRIEDKWDLCYKCDQERKKDAPAPETPFDRQTSIERQVAAKCAAQQLTGVDATPETIGMLFVAYLNNITGREKV